jgi:hypothetical protein
MEKDYSFGIKEDQWGSDYLTIKTDGTVVEEGEDRKENQSYTGRVWTWAEFAQQYQGDKEPTYAKAAAFVADLLNPKTK